MNPKIWGPPAWVFLYSIVLNYPDNPSHKEKNIMRDFFMSLGNILPCEKCGKNYEIHVRLFPIDDKVLTNKYTLFNWLNTINNQVQISLNKRQYSAQERLQFMKDKYSTDLQNTSYLTITLLLITIVLVTILLFLKYKSF